MHGLKLFLIRKTKGFFLKAKLHKLLTPFESALMNLAYLPKFSRWRAETPAPAHNDFFSMDFTAEKRYNLYKYILEKEKLDGEICYLEFGVAFGHSFRWWVENNRDADSEFYGFDTFTGLPEQWAFLKPGEMSTEGRTPEIDDNRYKFLVGLFQDTLPKFLKEFAANKKRLVINLDADLYTSTLYVLTRIAPYLKPGDILIFDEFGVPTHEFRAFEDFSKSYYLKYETLAAANNYYQVAMKILELKN